MHSEVEKMVYVRVTIYGNLAKRLKEHVSSEWSGSRGAQALVIRKALKEYLDREDEEATGEKRHAAQLVE